MSSWIKCSERLPTTLKQGVAANSIIAYGVNPERYNFWKERGAPELATPERFIACYVPRYGFLSRGFYFYGELEKQFVTHWVPLPAEPEDTTCSIE